MGKKKGHWKLIEGEPWFYIGYRSSRKAAYYYCNNLIWSLEVSNIIKYESYIIYNAEKKLYNMHIRPNYDKE